MRAILFFWPSSNTIAYLIMRPVIASVVIAAQRSRMPGVGEEYRYNACSRKYISNHLRFRHTVPDILFPDVFLSLR